MKRFKRYLSILLCVVMIVSIFVPCQKAFAIAPAIAPAIVDGVYYVVIWALGCLGITVAHKGGLLQAVSKYLADNPSIYSYLSNNLSTLVVGQVGAGLTLHFIPESLSWIKNVLMPSLVSYFSRDNTQLKVPKSGYFVYGTAQIVPYSDDAKTLFFMSPYNADTVVVLNSNGLTFEYSMQNYGVGKKITLNGEDCFTYDFTSNDRLYVPGGYASTEFRWGFFKYYSDGLKSWYLQPYIVVRGVLSDGSVGYIAKIANCKYVRGSMCLVEDKIQPVTESVSYDYVIDYSLSEFYNALQNKIDSMTGAIDIPIPQIGQDVAEGKQSLEDDKLKDGVPYFPDWSLWWENLGIKDLIKTVKESVSQTEVDVNVPEVPASIADKFPFCVPFDLFRLIKALNASPSAPIFTVPLKFDSINYQYDFRFDLSQYDNLVQPIRIGITLIFLLGLIMITRKLIKG
ncbi:MAG: hypothetical protein GX488_11075 [Clostridiales bacterium]|nr:hypothetical protein [Clostridiales bacterium]